MTTTPVEVRGLTKRFYDDRRGGIRAVDGIDFECRTGEIFGLLGPTAPARPRRCACWRRSCPPRPARPP